MDKNITILMLMLSLLPLSCKKNTQDPEPEYNSAGTEGPEPARENAVTTDPWEMAGTPVIPDSITIDSRFRSLIFEDGFRMDYDGDTAEDGNGIGNTEDEEICRQQEIEGEVYGVCMELFDEKRVFCKIDDAPQSDCNDVYSQLGDRFECESGSLNGDPALRCSDGWGVLANGEKDRSKTICRVLLSDNSGHCLNAYKEEDDGTGTLIPVEAEELILYMLSSSWQGYNSGHTANPAQTFDNAPPLSPIPPTEIPEGAVFNYKTSNPAVCTVDNDEDETNGIKGTLSFVAGSAPYVCTVVLTVEKEQYADQILSFDVELVQDNDSTWIGYASALASASHGGIFYAQETLTPDAIAGTLSTPESTYSTEDESICTVDTDSGEVTGVDAGICIVNRIVSQDGYLDKELPTAIPVTPLRQYQGLHWMGFPDDGDIAVGNTSNPLPIPTSIPPAIGMDEYTIEWKSGDCIWTGGTTRTITIVNTIPCVITVTIKKRGYEDFSKDFTVNPTPGSQSGLSWNPSQNSGTVGVELVMDVFSITLTNNESLSYIVSDTGDTGCTFKGLSGNDARTLIFQKDGICIVQAVVSRSGYEDWLSPETSIVVTTGSIQVSDWGNYEDVLNGSTTDAPRIGDVTPTNVTKIYTSNTQSECTVDSETGTVNGIRIGDDNCTILLTLSQDGYSDTSHNYTLSVLVGVVDMRWDGYDSESLSIADGGTPPTLIPPISSTPGANFSYSTDDTTCNVHSGTGTLTILTPGTCTITLTASADNYRSIKKDVTINITQAPQAITLSSSDAADVYGTSPTLSVGTTLSVDTAGATLPSGGVGPLSYQSNDENICTTDTAGTVTGTGVGSCIVSLYFAGDANTAPSNSLEILNLDVAQGIQTTAAWSNPYGSSPLLKVNGNNLEIKNSPPDDHGHGVLEYSSEDASICEVDSVSGEIDPMGGGNCVVQIRYMGNENYLPSSPVELITILVRRFSQPPLTAPDNPYGPLPTLTVGTNLPIANPPQASGYTPAEYRPKNGENTICSVEPETGEITPHAVGTCIVEARFSESSQYQPSDYVTIATITVERGSQTLELPINPYGDTPVLSASGGDLDIENHPATGQGATLYRSTTAGQCTVDENTGTISPVAVGECVVEVQYAGNSDYLPSDYVEILRITVTP